MSCLQNKYMGLEEGDGFTSLLGKGMGRKKGG
jgi:hypothetical protein